jgi:hypothetical protein
MVRNLVIMAALVMVVVFNSAVAWTADQQREQERILVQEPLRDQDIYGWELMTVAERNEHRSQLLSLKTEQEREQYLQEHHAQMQGRARAQGRTLPDMMDMPNTPADADRGVGPVGGGEQGR